MTNERIEQLEALIKERKDLVKKAERVEQKHAELLSRILEIDSEIN